MGGWDTLFGGSTRWMCVDLNRNGKMDDLKWNRIGKL